MAPGAPKVLLTDIVSGSSKVPANYIRPANDRPDFCNVADSSVQSIPVIDMQGLGGQHHRQVVDAIGLACETDGFFMICQVTTFSLSLLMDTKECLTAQAHPGFMPELLTLPVSVGILYHFRFGGSPSDDNTLMTCYLQLFITMLTLFLGLTLLPLRLVAHPSPSPALQRWIHHLGTATLAATFATLALAVTNSTLPSPHAVSWASEWVLIILAIAVAFKLISVTPMSCFQQYIKVGIFSLCVAIARVYNEPLDSMASTISFSSVVYRTYQAHQFGLVPCTFGLAVLLLTLGVAVPGNSVSHFVSVEFKEVFAKLTLSVGCVTLLTSASLTVCASTLSSAGMVVRVGPGRAAEGIQIEAI